MLLSGQRPLDLHVHGAMKTSMLPDMFDASWNENDAEQNQ